MVAESSGTTGIGVAANATPLNASIERHIPGADQRIFEFFRAWQAARRGALVPMRGNFDPMTVPGLLANMWMYRFEAARGDFVCRLAGEQVNLAWGGSIRGKTLRQIVGTANHDLVLQRWKFILRVPLVHYGSAAERLSAQETRIAERLLLPLSSDPDTVDHILGVSFYELAVVDRSRPPLVPEDIVQFPCAEV